MGICCFFSFQVYLCIYFVIIFGLDMISLLLSIDIYTMEKNGWTIDNACNTDNVIIHFQCTQLNKQK